MSASAIDERKNTLNNWYNEVKGKIIETPQNSSFYQYTSQLNYECIEKEIKLSEIGEQELNFAEAMFLLYGSGIKCLDLNKQNDVWVLMVDSLINFYSETVNINKQDCFKMELKNIDPYSSILYGFDEHNMAIDRETCKTLVDINGLDSHITDVENAYGNLSTLTNGIIHRNDMKKYLLLFVVLGGGDHSHKDYVKTLLMNEAQYKLNSVFNIVFYNVNMRAFYQKYGFRYVG